MLWFGYYWFLVNSVGLLFDYLCDVGSVGVSGCCVVWLLVVWFGHCYLFLFCGWLVDLFGVRVVWCYVEFGCGHASVGVVLLPFVGGLLLFAVFGSYVLCCVCCLAGCLGGCVFVNSVVIAYILSICCVCLVVLVCLIC